MLSDGLVEFVEHTCWSLVVVVVVVVMAVVACGCSCPAAAHGPAGGVVASHGGALLLHGGGGGGIGVVINDTAGQPAGPTGINPLKTLQSSVITRVTPLELLVLAAAPDPSVAANTSPVAT